MIHIDKIKMGEPLAWRGRDGTIFVDRILLGTDLGWQIRYQGKVFSTKRRHEALEFIKVNLLSEPMRDSLGDVEDMGEF